MKNKLSGEAATPANADQLSSKEQARHEANRRLPTQTVLEFLRTKLPQQYEVAEIVGSWIWVEFSSDRQRLVADVLFGLGFHWNKRRGLWQHPCGMFEPFSSHPNAPPHSLRQPFRRPPINHFSMKSLKRVSFDANQTEFGIIWQLATHASAFQS